MSPRPVVGLCAGCRHCRIVVNRRNSRFYLCRRSEEDHGWPKYPRLPVMECRGFEEGVPEQAPVNPGAGKPVEGNDNRGGQE